MGGADHRVVEGARLTDPAREGAACLVVHDADRTSHFEWRALDGVRAHIDTQTSAAHAGGGDDAIDRVRAVEPREPRGQHRAGPGELVAGLERPGGIGDAVGDGQPSLGGANAPDAVGLGPGIVGSARVRPLVARRHGVGERIEQGPRAHRREGDRARRRGLPAPRLEGRAVRWLHGPGARVRLEAELAGAGVHRGLGRAPQGGGALLARGALSRGDGGGDGRGRCSNKARGVGGRRHQRGQVQTEAVGLSPNVAKAAAGQALGEDRRQPQRRLGSEVVSQRQRHGAGGIALSMHEAHGRAIRRGPELHRRSAAALAQDRRAPGGGDVLASEGEPERGERAHRAPRQRDHSWMSSFVRGEIAKL